MAQLSEFKKKTYDISQKWHEKRWKFKSDTYKKRRASWYSVCLDLHIMWVGDRSNEQWHEAKRQEDNENEDLDGDH